MLSDFFDISRRVFKSHEPFEVSIKARYFQMNLKDKRNCGRLYVEWMPDDSVKMDGGITPRPRGDITGWENAEIVDDNSETLRCRFPALDEGPVICKLFHKLDEEKPATLICQFNLYVLDEDMYSRRPFRGDCHIHTSFSFCGTRTEDPHFIAAVCRQRGMDFASITDHCQIEGSESVLDFPASVGSDFRIFRGEECHVLVRHVDSRFCDNPFFTWNHIVNIGGRDGVIRYMNDHYDEVMDVIRANAENLDKSYSKDLREAMAASDWIIDKIHEFGGLAVFAHPFWHSFGKLNLPAPLREYILKQAKFDVIELPGLGSVGSRNYDEDNILCTAWWQEACIKAGRILPVIGDSDCHHGRDFLGAYYSIVFSKDDSFESIAEAFKSGNAVGVQYHEGRELSPRITGSFRLVRYAQFLLNEYFPEHDELCQAEGNLMLANLRGDDVTKEVIAAFAGKRTMKCQKRFFGE